jgi:uncharacterized protein (TIGR03382 family)
MWGDGGQVWFAAPPPTLLLFAPFVALPGWLVAGSWVALDIAAIALVVRRLERPWWWCLFPPAVSAMTVGNPEPVMLALLVLGGGWLAPLVKPYAASALLGEGRYRSLLVAAGALLLTVPILPWGSFLADLPQIRATLESQLNDGDLSAWGAPILVPIALLALLALGRRRAGWLATPVLWPVAQLHYATIALPAVSPLMALAFSLPIPGIRPAAVIMAAVLESSRHRAVAPDRDRRRAERQVAGDVEPGPLAAAGRDGQEGVAVVRDLVVHRHQVAGADEE